MINAMTKTKLRFMIRATLNKMKRRAKKTHLNSLVSRERTS